MTKKDFSNYIKSPYGINLMSFIMDTLIWLAGIYLVSSFCMWNMNPVSWNWQTRLISGAIIFVMFLSQLRSFSTTNRKLKEYGKQNR